MKMKRALSGSSVLSIRQIVTGLAVVGGLVLATACSTTVSSSGSPCSPDSSVACSVGDGWSCDGSAQPEDTNSDLLCSADQGSGQFCCIASSCGYDSSVDCPGGGIGYSCAAGDPSPDTTDSSLTCSGATTVDNVDEYCCN
jgi:hypothetical protein